MNGFRMTDNMYIKHTTERVCHGFEYRTIYPFIIVDYLKSI